MGYFPSPRNRDWEFSAYNQDNFHDYLLKLPGQCSQTLTEQLQGFGSPKEERNWRINVAWPPDYGVSFHGRLNILSVLLNLAFIQELSNRGGWCEVDVGVHRQVLQPADVQLWFENEDQDCSVPNRERHQTWVQRPPKASDQNHWQETRPVVRGRILASRRRKVSTMITINLPI